jgi:putative PIN family toxin of toxin-antitoxin system
VIRVVLDTNIVISALLHPIGAPAQVFVLALGGLIQLCLTGNVYSEYEEVLSRPKFHLSEETIATALHAIREKSVWVRPTAPIRACSDPEDDRFLECAAAADAHYVVTGNLKHFPNVWAGTRVVTARWLLDSIADVSEPEREKRE